VLTATECLAHSVNAGLVQIGLRVPPEVLRGKLRLLRYSEPPDTGLGGERPGSLPKLPWRTSWEHASVCFGYETFVTLWQHAAALATVVRGGRFKPLRLLDAVEQDGRRWDLPPAEVADPEVFSAETCEQVREMMRVGASIGTGKHVIGPELVERYGMGSKTGTAERVGGEVCLHNELADAERHAREGSACSPACRRQLKQLAPAHGRSCRTLSMTAFGRRPSDGRELLALVVVDEPRDGVRFGSQAAGPKAVELLKEAMGLTLHGQPRGVERVAAGFRRGTRAPEPSSEQPWAEVAR
jgi:cell division protein FtsI/penicillin-binding protein 2